MIDGQNTYTALYATVYICYRGRGGGLLRDQLLKNKAPNSAGKKETEMSKREIGNALYNLPVVYIYIYIYVGRYCTHM